MNKKDEKKILKFPLNLAEAERQVEAILFAAEEPLDLKTIQERIKVKANVPKILESLQDQYKNRGINLISIAGNIFIYNLTKLSIILSPILSLFSG